jgi:hypothetical protein
MVALLACSVRPLSERSRLGVLLVIHAPLALEHLCGRRWGIPLLPLRRFAAAVCIGAGLPRWDHIRERTLDGRVDVGRRWCG